MDLSQKANAQIKNTGVGPIFFSFDFLSRFCYNRIMMIYDKTLYDRLMEKTQLDAWGCLNWTGAKNPQNRYGHISVFRVDFFGETVSTHRASYYARYGPFDKSKFILHKCDNRKCINPGHLYLGTAKDNTRDMYERGGSDIRYRIGRQTTIDQSTINKIVEIYKTGEYKLESLSKIFDIKADYIRAILSNKTLKQFERETIKVKEGRRLVRKQAQEVIDLYATGDYTMKKIGEIFNCDESTISRLIKGSTWPELDRTALKNRKKTLQRFYKKRTK